jgi:hypothetical protein
MRNRRLALPALAAAAALIAGACSESAPMDPRNASEDIQLFGKAENPAAHVDNTYDAQLARIAMAVPGYGGHFYDETGALNVVMTAAAQTQSASAVRRTLGGELASLGVDLAAQPLRMVPGQYDFAELHAMHQQVAPVLSLGGVVYTDAQERTNRIEIGVENAAAEAAVLQMLAMMRFPTDAVEIRTGVEPVEYMQTLQQRVRPVAGGLQINFPGFICTLGANVRSPQVPSVHGFITNSHCTNNQWDGAAGNTPYAQPSGVATCPAGDNCIGYEEFDAPFFTNAQNPICPVGRRCRWSDAAGARYLPGIENVFARIYRTTGVGSLVIDQANPFYNIVAEAPTNVAVGDSVFKVGRTTGFTRGVTTNSCVNFNIGSQDHYLCHDWVTGPSGSVGGGDSGSATWSRAPAGQTQNVRINGLLCCGSGSNIFIHSPMQGIRFDSPAPPGRSWVTH